MKTLPKLPYLQNIVKEYHRIQPGYAYLADGSYRNWLSQFGFRVPVQGDYLEFPDDFSEHDLMMFVLRWS